MCRASNSITVFHYAILRHSYEMGGSKDVPTLKSKGIVSVFRARINRFDEDFGFLSEGIFLAY